MLMYSLPCARPETIPAPGSTGERIHFTNGCQDEAKFKQERKKQRWHIVDEIHDDSWGGLKEKYMQDQYKI